MAAAIIAAGTGLWWRYSEQAKRIQAGVIDNEQIKKNLASKLVKTRQNQQKAAVKKYQAALQDSQYRLNNPYIKVNPYGRSPLSALAIFQTDEASKISLTVVGKTSKTSISTTYKTYSKQHQISILGLYADYQNTVKITATTKSGQQTTKVLHLKTASLPSNLASVKVDVKKADKTKMAIGNNKLTFIVRTTKQPFAIDADGAIRWYSTDYSQHVFKQLANGHILRLAKKNNDALIYNEMLEEDYTGRVYKEYHFGTGAADKNSDTDAEYTLIHHDAIELPNHNILATVSDGTAGNKNTKNQYVEDTIVEISHKTGKIVKVIDLKKILPSSMYTAKSLMHGTAKDWFHMNSLYYQKSTGDLVISGRHQDMVFKINYKTLNFKWIYCGKKKSAWPKSLQKYVLTPTGTTGYTGGQHAAILLPSTTNKTDVLALFNNNVAITNGQKSTSKKYSQAVVYKINLQQKKITKVWSNGQDQGKSHFSLVISSNRLMSNGNFLVDYGYLQEGKVSNVQEVTKSGQRIFSVYFSNLGTNGYVYRAERFSLYPNNTSASQTYE
ncbi:aryl-sulfate sulfotransferase [Lapidilactobacillus bayanensis]|uniref:aryl-sulfate sulfotransferase n=1 Tax=Lapidilactobacillus bayanensis TaxID=2485998 RepID=UPI0013DE4FC2|nr:aryl-sulfate sulfotransferase [Lapidilactobacillus bayanensis]